MQKITVEQLATLLWIKALDDYEDNNFKGLRDKYYNFIENNDDIEGMESSEFDRNKEFLVEQKLLKETNSKLEFTKKGIEVVEIVSKTEKENDLKPYQLEKGNLVNYADIKKFIDDNSNVLQVALATVSLLISIIQ